MSSIDAPRLMTLLFAAYPVETRNIPGDQAIVTARLYARMLADLDADEVVRAIERLIKTSERLPTVAKIRATVVELHHGPARAGADAWGDVRAAMSRHGYVSAPGKDFAFDDPLVARVVESMGWRRLCESDNATADRARFAEVYEHLAQQERTAAQAAPGAVSALLPRSDRPVALADAVRAHQLAQEGRS